jgi:hypothetical protein
MGTNTSNQSAAEQAKQLKARQNTDRGLQRGLLAVMTSGTSEIKTGAGEYQDETVADSLFPKTVNNMMSGDREDARKATDLAKTATADAANPGPAPDLADKLLARAGADSLRTQKTKQGRKSTFLSGY